MARVEAVDVDVKLNSGIIYTGCLKTLEWNPLETDSEEYKYYAPGLGLVREENLESGEIVELIRFE